MAVGSVVMAHREPLETARLVRRLAVGSDQVVVHVEATTPLEPFEAALAPLLARGGVHLAAQRFHCPWAGWGFIPAGVACARQLLDGPEPLSHVHLLSGADVPLRTGAERAAALEAGRSYVLWSPGHPEPRPHSERVGNPSWHFWDDGTRLDRRHFRVGGRIVPLPNPLVPMWPKLRVPAGLRRVQGSAWWTLAPEAIAALEAALADPVVVRYFRRTFAPDEFVASMVLLSGPLADTVVNEDWRWLDWGHYSPQALATSRIDEMRSTRKLFARKVDPSVDPTVRAALDDVLGDEPGLLPLAELTGSQR